MRLKKVAHDTKMPRILPTRSNLQYTAHYAAWGILISRLDHFRLRMRAATSTCFCSSAIIAAASSASLIARIANEQPPFLKLVKAYFLQSASPNVIKHPPHRLIVTIACLVQAAMLPPSRTVAPFRRNESRKA